MIKTLLGWLTGRGKRSQGVSETASETTPTADQTGLEMTLEALDKAIAILEAHGGDPPEDAHRLDPDVGHADPLGMTRSSDPASIAARNKAHERVQATIARWPDDRWEAFMLASTLVGDIVRFMDRQGTAIPVELDLEYMTMLSALAQLHKDVASGEHSERGPVGIEEALMDAMEARRYAALPYSPVLKALLGARAPAWFRRESASGHPKLQPHELARDGWHRLFEIGTQVLIENDLMRMQHRDAGATELLVANAWIMTALATIMEPTIFTDESVPRVTSWRGGQYTVSNGAKVALQFVPRAMPDVLRAVRACLNSAEVDAADMMWIALSLAEVRWHDRPEVDAQQRFELFLSHRGPDSKQALVDTLLEGPLDSSIFLDCLVLPRRIINRYFVLRSVTHSKEVLIVQSPNYETSIWCKKEEWFADLLQTLGRATVTRVSSTENAAQRLRRAQPAVAPARPPRPDIDLENHWVTTRILRDLDYWARRPNMHGLQESGVPTGAFASVLQSLKGEHVPEGPENGAHRIELLRAMFAALLDGAARPSDPKVGLLANAPFEAWSTAVQLATAGLTLGCPAYDKLATRRWIDTANDLTKALLEALANAPADVLERVPQQLLLLSAAVALELMFDSDVPPYQERNLEALLQGVGFFRSGTLLLDVRHPGVDRDLRLQLVALAVQCNVGTLGILQNGSDPVHQFTLDGRTLSVLPCVTLYPGMERLFATSA